MPIYCYRCQKCGHLEEILQRISDGPPESCSACTEPGQMLKEMAPTGPYQTKGVGWERDGYANKRNNK